MNWVCVTSPSWPWIWDRDLRLTWTRFDYNCYAAVLMPYVPHRVSLEDTQTWITLSRFTNISCFALHRVADHWVPTSVTPTFPPSEGTWPLASLSVFLIVFTNGIVAMMLWYSFLHIVVYFRGLFVSLSLFLLRIVPEFSRSGLSLSHLLMLR